jgi:hypothetical protein
MFSPQRWNGNGVKKNLRQLTTSHTDFGVRLRENGTNLQIGWKTKTEAGLVRQTRRPFPFAESRSGNRKRAALGQSRRPFSFLLVLLKLEDVAEA